MRIDDIRREHQLLLYCARTSTDEDLRSRCAGLLSPDFDWKYFLGEAERHRVVPLVHRSLARMPLPVPAAISAELANRDVQIARRNLLLAGRLVALLRTLEEGGIRAIPYKGPAIALLAYGGISLRQFWDLDVLVAWSDYRRARKVLVVRGGYEFLEDYGWECCLVDRTGTTYVDLHREVAPDIVPGRLDFDGLWQRCAAPAAGGLQTFCAEDMLIVLSVQLRKDAWETKDLRLSKICDIAELLRTQPAMDWQRVERQARRLGCQRALWIGLMAARDLLSAPVDGMALRLAEHARLEPLMEFLRFRLFSEGSATSTPPISAEAFHFAVRERWSDWIYGWYSRPWLRQGLRHMRPSPKDKAMVPLPARFAFLYYLIRPIRIGRDRVCAMFRNSKPT